MHSLFVYWENEYLYVHVWVWGRRTWTYCPVMRCFTPPCIISKQTSYSIGKKENCDAKNKPAAPVWRQSDTARWHGRFIIFVISNAEVFDASFWTNASFRDEILLNDMIKSDPVNLRFRLSCQIAHQLRFCVLVVANDMAWRYIPACIIWKCVYDIVSITMQVLQWHKAFE